MQLAYLAVKLRVPAALVDEAPAGQPGKGDHGAVLHDIHVLDDAVLLAVAGDIADAQPDGLGGGGHLDGLTLHKELPGVGQVAEDGLEQLAAAVAQQAGDTQHLAGVDGEGDVPEVGAVAQALAPEDLTAQLLVLVQVLGAHVVAHHEPGQVGGGHLGHRPGGHHVAVPQHGVPVADLHDLLELVGDEDDGHVLLLQHAHHIEHALNLRVGQGGGGLVHDNQGGLHHHGA